MRLKVTDPNGQDQIIDATSVVLDDGSFQGGVLGAADSRIVSGTGKTAKNRSAIGVGTTKKEITWVDGDAITEVTIIATYEAGAVIETDATPTQRSTYALVCFDVASAGVAALIGADASVVIPEALAFNQNGYLIPLNIPITIQFSSALSYDGTTYVGNMWVRSIDNTNQLDVWVGAS